MKNCPRQSVLVVTQVAREGGTDFCAPLTKDTAQVPTASKGSMKEGALCGAERLVTGVV